MQNKTCGDCRFYNSDFILCLHWRHEDINAHSKICNYFKPITNGDRIRQMSNKEFRDWYCEQIGMAVALMADSMDAQYRHNVLAWLNAPADAPDTNVGKMEGGNVQQN